MDVAAMIKIEPALWAMVVITFVSVYAILAWGL
jgi:hypothetical protein